MKNKYFALAVLLLATSAISHAQKLRVFPDNLYLGPALTKIYVEIDWMAGTHSHQPSQAVIDAIKATFANEGIELIVDVSNAIPHTNVINIPSGYNVSTAPEVVAIANEHFNHKNDSRYFYSIWAHNYSLNGTLTTSSGYADLPGRMHLVTLGSFSGQTGTINNQIGTFVHEFGHNINQRHAGASSTPNYKPNYISVMNYRYQLNGITSGLAGYNLASSVQGINNFGYSHGTLAALNELSLNEPAGIGLGTSADWNCDGDTVDSGVQRDLTQGASWCSAAQTDYTNLQDFDNWGSVASYVSGAGGKLASRMEALPDATPEVCVTAEEHEAEMARHSPERRAFLEADQSVGVAGKIATPTTFFVHNHGTAPLNITSIAPASAAPWIAGISPTSFTVAPSSFQTVNLSVDVVAAPYGPSTRQLLIGSNNASGAYTNGVFVHVNNTTPPNAARDWEAYY